MSDPFPMRTTGSRFDQALGNSLGANTALGTRFQAQNPARVHPRVQRWRASVQREISRNMAVEIAYNGSRGDRLDRNIRQDYLPEEWWNGSNVRDVTQQNLLNANVTNPFFISNFASLRTSDPALYNQMAGNSFFTSPTIQRHRLLRPFPHMSSGDGLELPDPSAGREQSTLARDQLQSPVREWLHRERLLYRDQIQGEQDGRGIRSRADDLADDVRKHGRTASRPTSSPSSRSAARSRSSMTAACSPRSSATGRSAGRTSGSRARCSSGPPANIFFYGDLDDIKLDNPTIERWFNTDAGFEKDPAKVPASFQKRAFPFRIDGVRAPGLKHLNMNIGRTVRLPGQQDAAIPRGRAQRLQQRDVRQRRT